MLSCQYRVCYLPVGLVSGFPAVLLPTYSLSTKNSSSWPSRPYLPYFVAYSSFSYVICLRHIGFILSPSGKFLPVLGSFHCNVLCQDLVITFPLLDIHSLVRFHLLREAFPEYPFSMPPNNPLPHCLPPQTPHCT